MQHAHQDTSTQAMTEVALGLSMAFFSLLILALFSIGLPEQVHNPITESNQQTDALKAEQFKLGASSNNPAAKQTTDYSKQQYVFYHKGQFFDQQLKPLTIQEFSQFTEQKPLILAVEENLPLMQVMTIRKQINHPNLSITMLNNNWLKQLEKVQ